MTEYRIELAFRTMNQLETQIPRDMALDVLTLAVQYHVRQFPNQSISELAEAGAEIYLAAELIEQATQNVQRQQAQRQQTQKQQAGN